MRLNQGHSALLSYGLAVGTVALGLLLTLMNWPLMRQMPFALLFAAIMVSGWVGGLGPGLLATALATLARRLSCSRPPIRWPVEGAQSWGGWACS